jgi:uncharacterized membrane protein
VKPAFIVLGVIIFIIFAVILYNEPSMVGITSLIDCILDNSSCQEGQKDLANNLLLFGLVVAGGFIAKREGWI